MLQVATGATSAVQGAGGELSQELDSQTAEKSSALADTGALDNDTLKGILKGEDLGLYNKAVEGKDLSEKELEKLQKALTKGVDSDGDDTAYLENGQYDANLSALTIKKQLMEADPTTKPSSIKKIDTAIERGKIYKEFEVPYDLISDYQKIGVEDWRKMGDPDYEDTGEYDPDMYEKLFDLDKIMTEKGVSYGKKEGKKAKYYAKSTGKGGGKGSGGKYGPGGKMSTEFGTLQSGSAGPKVQAYDTIETKTASVPRIGVKRPNIVHKITRSE
jgi:hypothetical protein